MPTLGREPSSLHPFDELLYGRLTELRIAFDEVFLANPVLLENAGIHHVRREEAVRFANAGFR